MKVYLLLGGNIGDTKSLFAQTIKLIQTEVGDVVQKSSLYESEPWGFEHEQNFLNQVVIVETMLEPINLLDTTQQIEKEMGRVRKKSQYSERTIDVDILFYDNLVMESERLTIPHLMLHQRRFTLEPLVELSPNFIHPKKQKTLVELLHECPDKLFVKRLAD